MHKRKLHNKISSGLLVLIAALSLAACGSTGDALEILDTESAQTEQTGQETATATPATSQTTPETTTEPKPKNLTYQTGLYQEKTLADQVSVDAARESFLKVKELTVRLSMVENSAYRLAMNIRKTQKRANALKNITIPSYTILVKDISNALEEKEREEFTRLKVIKRNMNH